WDGSLQNRFSLLPNMRRETISMWQGWTLDQLLSDQPAYWGLLTEPFRLIDLDQCRRLAAALKGNERLLGLTLTEERTTDGAQGIGVAGLRIILENLKDCRSLRELNFLDLFLGQIGATNLAESLPLLSNLTSLTL